MARTAAGTSSPGEEGRLLEAREVHQRQGENPMRTATPEEGAGTIEIGVSGVVDTGGDLFAGARPEHARREQTSTDPARHEGEATAASADEQAEPVDTAIPSRSSAITAASPSNPLSTLLLLLR